MTNTLVATITFAHEQHLLEEALAGVAKAVATNPQIDQLILDDSSGHAPRVVNDATVESTPVRGGYAAAVNWIVENYGNKYERLILVNPDASPSPQAIEQLASASSSVTVPQVQGSAGRIENLRLVASPWRRILSLFLSEQIVAADPVLPDSETRVLRCPPYVPAGSVIAFSMHELKKLPLDPEMFWIEMSDWIRRRVAEGPLEVEVLEVQVPHAGASTSVSYPLSVAASQLNADVRYVQRYGSWALGHVLPLAIISRSIRYAAKHRTIRGAVFLAKVGLLGSDWRILA